ncbi:hypothetical protein D3C71_1617480 [compost metagenome]
MHPRVAGELALLHPLPVSLGVRGQKFGKPFGRVAAHGPELEAFEHFPLRTHAGLPEYDWPAVDDEKCQCDQRERRRKEDERQDG